MAKEKDLVSILLDSDEGLLAAEKKELEIERLSKKFNTPFIITIQAIPARKYTEIQKRNVTINKKGISDANIYNLQATTVLEGVTYPDLHNSALCKKFKVATPLDLIEKLFQAGEIAYISNEISKLSGYDKTEDEKIDEIKN